MNAQLRKGFLEFCVLANIVNKDSYGYQIIKDINSCISISESTLYPILKRLETQQDVITYSVEHNGRLRKYYKITEQGKIHLEEFLENWKQIENIYHFIKGELKNE